VEARTEVKIRWRDLDPLGHLNQAVYHELLEEGRGTFFVRRRSFPFVLAHVELDYKAEVRKDHEAVIVVTALERVGRTSVTLAERIEHLDGTVAASGRAVLVAWDLDARRSRELTDDERSSLGTPDRAG
jgi:acyl-CoA thioester hydrolase